jgi:RimJ/RimL family protein N-acetyltransferase
MLGLVSFDQHHDGKDIEVSYALLPENQGRGYATEAVQIALRYAFDQMGLRRVVAETQSLNARSVALLQRIGMVFQRTVIRFGAEQSIYAALSRNLSPRPNPSLNTDVQHAGAAPRAAGRRLAPFR